MPHICWLVFKCCDCLPDFPSTEIHWHVGPTRWVSGLDSSREHSAKLLVSLHPGLSLATYSTILFQFSALERRYCRSLEGQGLQPSAQLAVSSFPATRTWHWLFLVTQHEGSFLFFCGLSHLGYSQTGGSETSSESTLSNWSKSVWFKPSSFRGLQARRALDWITHLSLTTAQEPRGSQKVHQPLRRDRAFFCTIALSHAKQNSDLQGSRYILRLRTGVKILYCSTNCVGRGLTEV